MLRSRSFLTACALAAASGAWLAGASPARADLTWNPNFNATLAGSTAPNGISPFQTATAASNWADSTTSGAQYVGALTSGVAINKNLIVNSGYLNFASTTGQNLWIGSSGSLTVTGGMLRFTGANNTTVYGYISNGGGVDATGQPNVNISGGTVWVTAVQDVNVTLSGGSLRLGGSGTSNSVTTGGAADPIAFTAKVNITSENATLEFARKASATVITDHVNTGEILINGNTLVQNTATYPAPWNGNAVITQTAYNQYSTFTTVKMQTDWVGSCVNGGGCTITYSGNCAGSWTQGGACTGSCTVAGVCTPVTTSASCAGTYAMGGACTPGLVQPVDGGFETTDCSTAYGPGNGGFTCLVSTPPAFNSQVNNWYDGDDIASRVFVADGTTNPATIHNGGTKWGYVGLPTNSLHVGGLWTRIGNYDPAHGDYKIALDVGDRLNSTFTSVGVALYTGNFTPMENVVPGELGGTPVIVSGGPGIVTTSASITWSSATATAARTGSVVATIPNVNAAGVAPQAGDALYVLIYDNNSGDVCLIDNVTVLGSCCDVNGGCTMTASAACGSPSSYSQNGSCTPSNPCTPPMGGCCVGATCNAYTSAQCTTASGAWTINDTSCTASPCSAPTGVCCTLGNCTVASQATCTGGGGSWDNTQTSCPATNTCPTQCCTFGTCTFVDQATCASGGGTSTVGGAACASNPCPQPTGICCDNTTGTCTVLFSGSCASGTTAGTGTTCSSGSCPVIKICCNSITGECVVRYSAGAACPANNANGTGTTCMSGSPSINCPPTKICCDTAAGSCQVMYSTSTCAAIGTGIQGSGTTCTAGVPSTSCPPIFCCNNTTGACSIRYGVATCLTGASVSSGGTCSAGSPSDSCPVIGVCCNITTGACAGIYGSNCANASLGSAGTGTTCDTTTCNFVMGACCKQNSGGVAVACTVEFSSTCSGLASPGTFLGNGVACPAGACWGEHEPNSTTFSAFLNDPTTNPAVLASGDAITGIATGSDFDAGNNGNGSASNGHVDLWLVSTAAAPLGIYRHEMTQIQGSVSQGYGLRGQGQNTGALSGGNLPLQSGTGTSKLTVWYGFGKQESIIIEPFSGSTVPYLYKLTDTTVQPTMTTGSVATGAVTIRIVSTGGTTIDSDVWLYDSGFNAITNDATNGPGGADGVLAGGPAGTTTSFTRTLAAGTYYLAVSPANLANDQPNDPSEGIVATTGSATQFTTYSPNIVLCSKMAQAVDYTCHVELTDSTSATIMSPDIAWTGSTTAWSGQVNFVQFTVGTSGVCCRGATCNTSVTQANCTGDGLAGGFFAASAACNTPGNSTNPCCYPDYNKTGGITVGDIFDFLNDWFGGSKFAILGGDGNSGTLSVQNIFDFLNAWFAGGC
jgi:hypothetical protein